MTDDIVTRLRNRAETWLDHCYDDAEQDREAADEIERLRALADQLAHALRTEMPNVHAPLSNQAIDAYDRQADRG